MKDVFSPEKRSEVMGKIRSKNTKVEFKMMRILKGMGLKFTRHEKLPGTPDFFLKKFNTVLFIDGCFWHGCPKCYRKPKHNAKYWAKKLENNKKRDTRINRELKKRGFSVIRIWEHDLKDSTKLKQF